MIYISHLAALVVVWSAVCALNIMSKNTAPQTRLSYVLQGVGEFAVLLAPGWAGREPTFAELALVIALAVTAVADRRRRLTRSLFR